ncbi:unnamed protein product [Cyprideis torosa]|uniref:Uncharacterized protein n=1 Tax=Cyprideis torosa TaxID=163714 RepID=A0A7R8W8W8_9CRUS|nr:unnamed protein product [Cyprideis torosa]CAG0889055.1 unnamed protein product [Cyprideis torosa]
MSRKLLERATDGRDSLMPQIMALINLPGGEADLLVSSASSAKTQEAHPYYKRPGKGHNHDRCDACGEGGNIICCDNCPASFHLTCTDPPLRQEDLPPGEWHCRSCKAMARRIAAGLPPLPRGALERLSSSSAFGAVASSNASSRENSREKSPKPTITKVLRSQSRPTSRDSTPQPTLAPPSSSKPPMAKDSFGGTNGDVSVPWASSNGPSRGRRKRKLSTSSTGSSNSLSDLPLPSKAVDAVLPKTSSSSIVAASGGGRFRFLLPPPPSSSWEEFVLPARIFDDVRTQQQKESSLAEDETLGHQLLKREATPPQAPPPSFSDGERLKEETKALMNGDIGSGNGSPERMEVEDESSVEDQGIQTKECAGYSCPAFISEPSERLKMDPPPCEGPTAFPNGPLSEDSLSHKEDLGVPLGVVTSDALFVVPSASASPLSTHSSTSTMSTATTTSGANGAREDLTCQPQHTDPQMSPPPTTEGDRAKESESVSSVAEEVRTEEPVKKKESSEETVPSPPASEVEPILHKPPIVEQLGSALNELKGVAEVANPRTFDLPREFMPNVVFPGAEHLTTKRSDPDLKSSIEMDSNGIVPLPARFCFYCRKTCRKGPLLPCDYCDLFFHLDCLDPPMTNFPMGQWMCPNHAENFIDSHRLTQVSYTERARLWNLLDKKVDQNAVILDFLKNVRRENPPFRLQRKLPLRLRCRVPKSIKDMYQRPRQLREHCVGTPSSSGIPPWGYSGFPRPFMPDLPSYNDQREWLAAVVQLQLSAAKEVLGIPASMSSTSSSSKPSSSTPEEFSVPPVSLPPSCPTPSPLLPPLGGETVSQCPPSPLPSIYASRTEEGKTTPQSVSEPISNGKAEEEEAKVKHSQVSASELSMPMEVSEDMLEVAETVVETTEMVQESSSRSPLEKLSPDLVEVLAIHGLRELMGLPPSLPLRPQMRSHACLLPIGAGMEGKPPSFMMYRALHIGLGEDSQLLLGSYRACNYTSTKHACIVYDETSGQYELLNYSEFGTEVDGVMYSTSGADEDFTSRLSVVTTKSVKENPAVSAFRKMVKEQRLRLEAEDALLADRAYRVPVSCYCSSSPCSGFASGWESTPAVLRHGSVVRFGCLSFVFSIASNATIPRKYTAHLPGFEGFEAAMSSTTRPSRKAKENSSS